MGERHFLAPPAAKGYWAIDVVQDAPPLVVNTATGG
jgi:hypothetical protein